MNMKTIIRDITGEKVFDSRGKPTLSVSVLAEGGMGNFMVPSGASTGSREAVSLSGDDGIARALRSLSDEIAPRLRGLDASKQVEIDRTLLEIDGTANKSRCGGNTLIGVSVAAARAAAAARAIPLHEHLRSLADIRPSRRTPKLFINLINGGKHAQGGSSIQEHQIITESDDPRMALEEAKKVEHALSEILNERHIRYSLGDEGGVVFPVATPEESFSLLAEARDRSGAHGITIGADAAASSFYADGAYTVCGKLYTKTELAALYERLQTQVGLSALEDPFEENDLDAFADLARQMPHLLVIGDDLTTTSAASIQKAAAAGAIRGVIIKPNQIGTLSETLDAMKSARDHDVECIISHRSGETLDTFIADLAFAFGAYGLKAGAPSAPERRAKYERLIEIAYA